jgi:hypothetical protein
MESRTPEKNREEIERLSPDNLITMFSRSPLLLACVLSVVIHGLLTVATSWEYAYDNYINKKPVSSLEEQPAATNGTDTAAATNAPAVPQTNAVVVPSASTNASAVEDEETAKLRQYSNAPVVQAIMQVAGTNEIPKVGDDIGISIKETNPF